MQSIIDCPADERDGTFHGYTKDDSGNIWYWKVDGLESTVEFREHGYPIGHPIKTAPVPESIREHAQTYVDALTERDRLPWY